MSGIYKILIQLRSWPTLFWSLAFPILLSTIFKFMFGGIATAEAFTETPVGIVVSAEKTTEEKAFTELAASITMEEQKMFEVTEYTSFDEANTALKNGEIVGIIDVTHDFSLTFKQNGVKESIVKTFTEQYMQTALMVENVAKEHAGNMEEYIEIMDAITSAKAININAKALNGADRSPFVQYMFSVIGMTCLIAANMGCYIAISIQADASPIAARRSVSPTGKGQMVFTDFLASYLLYDVMSMLVLLYMRFALQIDFGPNMLPVVLVTLVGNFCGLAAGLMIGVCTRGSIKKKDGLCVAFFMGSSFLAGLQWGDIVRLLEKNAPIVNRINPATLIVNSFKSWSVFGDMTNYFINIATLLVIGVLFLGISVIKLRRTKYASV